MTTLPTDLEIAQNLASVRVAVLDATQHVRSPKRSTRYRTTRNLIIAGVAIAALTAGAIVAVQASQYDIDHTVTCYEERSLTSRQVPVLGAGDTEAEPLDPIEVCASIWRNGRFEPSTGHDADPDDGTDPVPELVLCRHGDGSAAVFPRDDGPASDEDFCEALGLADGGSD